MKQYLLPEQGSFYKANLHCHSTISDGTLTPEQLRDAYKAHGYSVLAITDHELMIDHTALSDENFLLLNGYEAYVKERQGDPRYMKTCHMNFIARDPKQLNMVCVDPQYVGYAAKNGLTPEELPRVGDLCRRRYGPRCINCMIKTAVENNYLVAYNHPGWSLETIEDIGKINGMYAIEIYNNCTAVYDGFPGNDSRVYDELLRQGRTLYCLANDDNHNKLPFDHPACDSFGAFNMIKAESLTYDSIIDALEKGNFYASQGPEISALYIEDGKLHVSCSDVHAIYLCTCGRPNAAGRLPQAIAAKGCTLREAAFDLLPDDGYVRVEIVDPAGRHAWTHAYSI